MVFSWISCGMTMTSSQLKSQATSLRPLGKVQSSSSNIESLKKGAFPIGRKKRSRIYAFLNMLTLHLSFQLEKAFVSSKSMGFPTFFGLSGILLYFIAIIPPLSNSF
jgi:hypothetical protein